MQGSVWLGGEWAFLPLFAIVPMMAWYGARTKAGARAIVLQVVALLYMASIVAVTFFPLPLPPYDVLPGVIDYRGWPYPWLSPIPLETIRATLGLGFEWPAARYLVGNVLAFLPVGVIVPLLRPASDWRRVFVVALLASLAIELTQLATSLLMGFPYRVADVDDVILNVLGAVLGWSVARPVFGRGGSRYPSR